MPVDRGVIDGQLREIGEGERWWEVREFRDLPYVLRPEERIHALVQGALVGPRRPRLIPASRWLIVLTAERLIFLRMERFGRQQVDVPLDQITGIRHRSRLRAVQVTLEAQQRRYRVRIPKQDAFRFVGALAPLIPRAGDTRHFGTSAHPSLLLSGLFTGLGAVPGPDYATRAELTRLENTVERLEGEVERLHQHVEFLESLLHERAEGRLSLPGTSADP